MATYALSKVEADEVKAGTVEVYNRVDWDDIFR